MPLPPLDVLVSFGLVVAILTVTPGVDTALVLRSAAVAGSRRAWGVIVGVQIGVLAWGLVAAIGVGALLAASQVAYDVLRLAGAAYMIWLGLRLVIAAIRGSIDPDEVAVTSRGSFRTGLRQGAVTNLLNPKVGAFYVAVLPQLIPETAPHLSWGAALAGVHVLLGVVWLGAIALLARSLGSWLRRPVVTRWIDGVAGTVVTGFGVRLALHR